CCAQESAKCLQASLAPRAAYSMPSQLLSIPIRDFGPADAKYLTSHPCSGSLRLPFARYCGGAHLSSAARRLDSTAKGHDGVARRGAALLGMEWSRSGVWRVPASAPPFSPLARGHGDR